MTGNKTVLLSALAFVMAGCITVPSVQAADDVVLFKIHDVTPIKNNDGNLVGCDYNATFYNRSNYSLKSANLNFVWFDDTISELADQEQKKQEKQNARSSRNRRNTSNVAESSSVSSVSSSITLSDLEPFKQKTVHAKLSSDRCFLLMGDVSLAATDCDITSANNASPFQGSQGCNGFFRIVSSTNPEYYSEFKAVTPQDEHLQQENARVEQRNKINQAYGDTLAQFKKVSEALSAIKGNVDPEDVEPASLNDVPAASTDADKSASNSSEANLNEKLDQLFPDTAATQK